LLVWVALLDGRVEGPVESGTGRAGVTIREGEYGGAGGVLLGSAGKVTPQAGAGALQCTQVDCMRGRGNGQTGLSCSLSPHGIAGNGSGT
jgi:hypothetical protein